MERVFEVGAGYGYNLDSMREAFSGTATFTDEVNREITYSEALRRAQLTDGPWDLIILSHVLEHFTDPIALVQTAVDQLVTGGVLLIEVPNVRAGSLEQSGRTAHAVLHSRNAPTTAGSCVGQRAGRGLHRWSG